MIPFYIYYSMFGLQRVGDLCWLAGDMRARGFLMGGTAGRTTLNGEGLQHEDGHSHVLASTIPNCISYDPTFAYEVVVIVREGIRRMYEAQEDVYYYITLMNENYQHPAMPAGAEAGIIKGLYLLLEGAQRQGSARAAHGLGHDPARSRRRRAAPARRLEGERRHLERDELQRAAPRRHERGPPQPAAPDASRAARATSRRRSKGIAGPVIAATDYMRNYADQVRSHIPRRYVTLGTDGFGRSDYRVQLRRFFEVNRYYVAVAALKALADDGEIKPEIVEQAIKKYGLDTERPDPWTDHDHDTIEVKVPDIGDFKDMPVIEVLVKPGDSVKAEDSLVTLESDKATMDVPAPFAGTVKELKVKVGDKVSEGSLILLLSSGAPAVAAAAEHHKAAVSAPPAPTSAPAGVAEVRVPDIGDFKDVPVIEVLVKPGDTVKPEDALVTLESDKATMDVPAPLGGVVRDIAVKVGDKVSEGALVLTLVTDGAQAAAAVPPPGAGAERAFARAIEECARAGAPPSPAAGEVDEAGFALAYAGPGVRKLARELGVDLATVKGSGEQGTHHEGGRRSGGERWRSAAKPAPAAAAGGGVGGIELLPWPKVDFAKFGPIEAKPLSRIKKISGANLHRNWVMIPHVTNHDDADITELEAFRVQLNKEIEKSGVKVSMLAFMIKAAVATLKKFPEFNASLDGDNLILKQYYHIGFAADTPNGPRGAGDPRRRQEGRGRHREGDGRSRQARARRQAQARPDAGRHVHHLEPGRHRRHLLHADHQRAGSRDHGRVPLVLEAGVGGRQDLGVALHPAAVAVVGPPRHRRRVGGALQRAFRRTARRHAPHRHLARALSDGNDRSQGPRHRRFLGRAGHRGAGQARRHGREGGSLVTLESDKATMDVPSPVDGVVKELKVKVGDKVSEGSLILTVEAAGAAPSPQPALPRVRRHRAARSIAARGRAAEARSRSSVPDIGDFKDVPVIEVLVKAGDTVKPEDALVTLESDKATMDVPSPAAGKIADDQGQGRRQGVGGQRDPDAVDRVLPHASPQPSPQAGERASPRRLLRSRSRTRPGLHLQRQRRRRMRDARARRRARAATPPRSAAPTSA